MHYRQQMNGYIDVPGPGEHTYEEDKHEKEQKYR